VILLYNPRSSPNKKPVLPMSVLAVGAQLEGAHEYRIIDGNLVDSGLGALESAIETRHADIVGMTVMPGPQLADALPIARRLRERYPGLTIVWGGYFPTMHPRPVLGSGCVDYVVRGHNEISFRALADRLAAGEPVGKLPGLARPGDDAKSLAGTAPGLVPDVNRLPDFPYERVPMERYLRPTFLGTRTISHHASYGCPFRCNFCAVVNMVDGRYSAQSAERMARTVDTLVRRYGANAIEFHDNNFFVGERRIAEFAARIRRHGIGWWAYGRIDTLDKFSDGTFSLLRDSGLKMVFMGAETGADEVLARMNKGGRQTTKQALSVVRRMARFGIVPEMSFVLGNPPEPERDVQCTLGFIRRVKAANPATEIILYLYSPVPLAGDLYEQARASGFRFPQTLEEWANADWVDFAQHRSADLPWLTHTVKQRVSDFQRVLQATYPTVTDPRLKGYRRTALRLLGAWRYRLRFYRYPFELRLLNRLFPYQRPEVTGF
jgi:anaerobic magnesium-protoporphyrin IX monomethyl ester cyclase